MRNSTDSFLTRHRAANFGDVTFQSVKFLINIQFLAHQRKLRFESIWVRTHVQFIDALPLPRADSSKHIRHPRPDAPRDSHQVGAARLEHFGNSFAFACPHLAKRGQGLRKRPACLCKQ